MEIKRYVAVLLAVLAMHWVYMTLFCEWQFFILTLLYVALACGIYKGSKAARYLSLVILLLHLFFNISLIGFVYYPVGEGVSGADQVFLLAFDQARFLIEVIPPTLVATATFFLLLFSAARRC
ncbi:MAG: hypothetical protein VX920_01730 [Pseudomonadota bacterium]|nr:hypothetical protein [Pseudomonadota bacterium]